MHKKEIYEDLEDIIVTIYLDELLQQNDKPINNSWLSVCVKNKFFEKGEGGIQTILRNFLKTHSVLCNDQKFLGLPEDMLPYFMQLNEEDLKNLIHDRLEKLLEPSEYPVTVITSGVSQGPMAFIPTILAFSLNPNASIKILEPIKFTMNLIKVKIDNEEKFKFIFYAETFPICEIETNRLVGLLKEPTTAEFILKRIGNDWGFQLEKIITGKHIANMLFDKNISEQEILKTFCTDALAYEAVSDQFSKFLENKEGDEAEPKISKRTKPLKEDEKKTEDKKIALQLAKTIFNAIDKDEPIIPLFYPRFRTQYLHNAHNDPKTLPHMTELLSLLTPLIFDFSADQAMTFLSTDNLESLKASLPDNIRIPLERFITHLYHTFGEDLLPLLQPFQTKLKENPFDQKILLAYKKVIDNRFKGSDLLKDKIVSLQIARLNRKKINDNTYKLLKFFMTYDASYRAKSLPEYSFFLERMELFFSESDKHPLIKDFWKSCKETLDLPTSKVLNYDNIPDFIDVLVEDSFSQILNEKKEIKNLYKQLQDIGGKEGFAGKDQLLKIIKQLAFDIYPLPNTEMMSPLMWVCVKIKTENATNNKTHIHANQNFKQLQDIGGKLLKEIEQYKQELALSKQAPATEKLARRENLSEQSFLRPTKSLSNVKQETRSPTLSKTKEEKDE